MKKIIYLSLILVMILVAGCSNSENTSGTKTEDGKTKIQFWYTMAGDNGKMLKKLVEDFNEQSDSVEVEMNYQGSYDDIRQKLQAGGSVQSLPAVIMTAESDVPFMINGDFAAPIHEFIAKEDDFDISELDDVVVSRYEHDDELHSMPFSASVAIMYYNKDLFEEAGLDPDNPPKTFNEVKEAAEKITKETNADGFSFPVDGFYFQELLANQNALFVNEDNGHSGTPTEAVFNQEEGLNIFKWLDDMHKSGALKNLGRDVDRGITAFIGGELGITIHTVATLRSLESNSNFDMGVAEIPVPDGIDPQGQFVGGNTLWITKDSSEDEQEAAWELLKFLTNSETQGEWAAETGYLPVTKEAVNSDELIDAYEEIPQMKKGWELLEQSKPSPATAGSASAKEAEAYDAVEETWEKLYRDGGPEELIDEAANKVTDILNK